MPTEENFNSRRDWPRPMTPEMPVFPQQPNWPQGVTPEMPVRPQRPPQAPSRPSRPAAPQIPVRPQPPRPPQQFAPVSFPILPQTRIGLIITGRGSLNLHRLPLVFSQVIARIPHNTHVWILGEGNGWTLISYGDRYGFADSRFVLPLR